MNNEVDEIPLQPIEEVFNEKTNSTIGMYLKENEMYDVFLRLKEYVESTFEIDENLPPQ